MKLKKSYIKLGFGKLPTKFLLLTFIALVTYIFINLISPTSVFSVKVDMFIKMQSVRETLFNISSKKSIDIPNETDTLESFPAYESERERGEERVYRNVSEPSFNSGTQDIISDVANKPSKFMDFHKYDRLFQRYNDSKGETLLQSSNSSENKIQLRRTKTKDESVKGNRPLFQANSISVVNVSGKSTKAVTDINKKINNLTEINIFGNIVNGRDNKRQLDCDSCFQHNFNYVVENDICKLYSSDQEIKLLILITTSPRNIKARSALRATWLSFTESNTANIRYAFLLGESKNHEYNEIINKEDNSFHDIIKEDFIDTYMNLTYKTIMGFKWAATKCAYADFVMKTDDDMFVNIPNVLRIIRSPFGNIMQHAIVGTCSLKAKPIRNMKSKWFASLESYPQDSYPGFCSGTGYVTSMNVVTKIYEISPHVPFFHLEDVYVALCVRKLGFGLQRTFGFNAGRPRLDPCIYKGNRLVTAHQMSPLVLQIIWRRQCSRVRIQ